MPFATRADLLARTNARRLAQLAVPADMAMPPEAALRVAIDGGDLSGYTADEQSALAGALGAMDTALADADALILSYGIPDTVQTTLIARLASTVALYYLQGAERMTDDVRNAYQGVIDTLKAHARGELNLIPAEPPLPTDPVISDDLVQFESSARRYGGTSTVIEDW
ncbi:phage protein Gp36 family protein [Methylomonas sp. MS20]|uniref:phage protein Gp36 family protein n=1 Tax=unclassified Methylomonas TaxID=2608980 RepID=UPI0028A50673|nr:phage protein Gp36 family protein [Methylomonas sp. MV1]MDT4328538.1 phage protein Gp36 family protein [Methylomonas sp. MV1]